MGRFDYILQKIASTELSGQPFRHLSIEGLFEPGDFSEILQSPEVRLEPSGNDRELIAKLHETGFKEITFPGTTTDLKQYLQWHQGRKLSQNSNTETCEGMGVTFRLQKTGPGTLLREIEDFFKSEAFLRAIAAKFGVELGKTYPDLGLQKYLDGYEISPHPDIRKKALTYMININPAPQSETLNYHTHYLSFTPEREYVTAFWRGNPKMDRCWVPWDWCQTQKRQTKNNSLVLFSPADDTLHAVKAAYDHLPTQRTQFYGNLWYHDEPTLGKPNWRDLDVIPTVEIKNNMKPGVLSWKNIRSGAKSILSRQGQTAPGGGY